MTILAAFLLIVLWLLGLLTGSPMGDFSHLLLLAAVFLILIGLLQQSAKRDEPL